MRIVQVCPYFKPMWEGGGVTRIAYDISKAMVELGHDVTVVSTNMCLKGRDHELPVNTAIEMDGMTVYYLENHKRHLPTSAPPVNLHLPRNVKEAIRDCDVMHVHDHRNMLEALVCGQAKRYSKPYLIQAHGSVLPFFQKQLQKRVFDRAFGDRALSNASGVIALTNLEADQYVSMGVPRERVQVIPNGIDTSLYKRVTDTASFRERAGIDKDSKIVLFLGRLHKIKGIDVLLRSYAQLCHVRKDTTLVLAGPDDGYRQEALSLTKDLGLSNQVKFLEMIDGPPNEAYSAADVLVYPSLYEIFGLVPFEALLCGTPVVVSSGSGCSELIEKARCGLVAKNGDINDLEGKIEHILGHPEESRSMALRGSDFVKDHLSSTKISKRIEAMYMKIIDEKVLEVQGTVGPYALQRGRT